MSLPLRPLTPDQILARDEEFLLPAYSRYGVVMESGQGVYLTDVEGRRYLDLMAGLGVNALGHCHPRMVRALSEQGGRLVHLSPLYAQRYSGELAERLCGISGMACAFFSTGGTEAVEGAMKLARRAAYLSHGPGKHVFVTLDGSYHGRSYGSLSITAQEKYQESFGPMLPEVRSATRNDIASLRAAMADDVCALMIEPLMGEGGVHACSREFLAEARRLADAHQALLIFDEIQCGLGRTGKWFAFEHTGIRPDVLIIGKPLGGGLPLSSILVDKRLRDTFGPGKHGSTLGGSPLACRLGIEFLSIMEDENLLDHVRQMGAYLRQGLLAVSEEHENAVEARGQGLLQGLELRHSARSIADAALAEGILYNVVQGNVIRFLPPFLLEKEHVDRAIEVLGILLRRAAEASAPVRQGASVARV